MTTIAQASSTKARRRVSKAPRTVRKVALRVKADVRCQTENFRFWPKLDQFRTCTKSAMGQGRPIEDTRPRAADAPQQTCLPNRASRTVFSYYSGRSSLNRERADAQGCCGPDKILGRGAFNEQSGNASSSLRRRACWLRVPSVQYVALRWTCACSDVGSKYNPQGIGW